MNSLSCHSARSPQWLRRKWWSIKKNVPCGKTCTFQELLIHLKGPYTQSILEKCKIHDSTFIIDKNSNPTIIIDKIQDPTFIIDKNQDPAFIIDKKSDSSIIIDKSQDPTFIIDTSIINKDIVDQQTSNVPVSCLGVNFNLQGNKNLFQLFTISK